MCTKLTVRQTVERVLFLFLLSFNFCKNNTFLYVYVLLVISKETNRVENWLEAAGTNRDLDTAPGRKARPGERRKNLADLFSQQEGSIFIMSDWHSYSHARRTTSWHILFRCSRIHNPNLSMTWKLYKNNPAYETFLKMILFNSNIKHILINIHIFFFFFFLHWL